MATLLRPTEVAEALRISRFAVYDLIKRGALPAIRVGHQFRIESSALATYREQQRRSRSASEPESGELILESRQGTSVLAVPGDLLGLPDTTVSVILGGRDGLTRHRFRGVPLYQVLAAYGMVSADDPLPRGFGGSGDCRLPVQSYVVARARDGHAAVFALAELAPEYAGTGVLLAWERDGDPLGAAGPVQLVVPNDSLGCRSIRQLVGLEVRTIDERRA